MEIDGNTSKAQTMYMRLFSLLTLVLLCCVSSAQGKSIYKSASDELVTIRTLSILPVFDNLRGIYARPVESHLVERLKSNHRWENLDTNMSGPVLTPDELEENAEALKSLFLSNSRGPDAFIATSITKGPSGISMKMSLFLRADQKLFAQETFSGLQSFDVESVKRTAEDLFKKLVKKIPYSGVVLSRQGTRVTINLGRRDGVGTNQVVSVVQIIKLVRHPKFHFLISTEKEVLGKIKLLKVDETLSFGRIITEKEPEAIQVNAKVTGLDSIAYENSNSLSEKPTPEEALAAAPDAGASFGENPVAWLPKRKPIFGVVGARLGVGQFQESIKQSSTLEAKAPLYPSFTLDGELWLTPVWSLHASMRQGIISTDNPVSGGSPSELSHSLSSYDFLFGYNLRLSPVVNSARIEALFGYSSYRLFVDGSSSGALTTKTYSGVKLGVSGLYPISNTSPYSLGADLYFLFNSKLKETPPASGSSDNSVNQFGVFVDKTLSMNLRARARLDFELYSSDFSGGSTTSSSQKHTTLSAGLYYLF